jgi:transcriptional regulator GlxA family with amidase domain
MKNLLVVAFNGMLDSSYALTMDTLRTANVLHAGNGTLSRVRVAVVGHTRSVVTGGGLKLATDYTFAELRHWPVVPDWIVIPGLGAATGELINARLQDPDMRGLMSLLQAAPESTRIGASCASVFLLAQAGLLSGKPVTTTWWLASVFRARYPQIALDETKMLVQDGRMLTAGSAFAQLDLVLAIITDVLGSSIAHLCSRYLLIDQRPSQARYMMPAHVQQTDPAVVAAERWIDARISEPISITELASAMAMSTKTLSRRVAAASGVSPLKLVQRRRLLAAVHLIETTPLPVEVVAARVGYQDGTALRKIIKRELATTPTALRSDRGYKCA